MTTPLALQIAADWNIRVDRLPRPVTPAAALKLACQIAAGTGFVAGADPQTGLPIWRLPRGGAIVARVLDGGTAVWCD